MGEEESFSFLFLSLRGSGSTGSRSAAPNSRPESSVRSKASGSGPERDVGGANKSSGSVTQRSDESSLGDPEFEFKPGIPECAPTHFTFKSVTSSAKR